MSDDEKRPERGLDQSALRFDDAPGRFRADHQGDRFAGASGVLFEQAMAQTRMAICLVDPHLPDLPIVFANRAFRKLTGYSEEEVVGRNCRFLQGAKTDPSAVAAIRRAIEREDVIVVELVNYRKNGEPFWNALHLGPIYNTEGDLVYFFGSQWDVTEVRAARAEERHAKEMARELSHRMKNMFAVISGIVNVTGRVHGIQEEAQEINGRIQALGRAYETTLDNAATGSTSIGDAIVAVLAPYGSPGDDNLEMAGHGTQLPFGLVSIISLILHELAANATRHGAWSTQNGRVKVSWGLDEHGDELILKWSESGGPQVDPETIDSGTGTAIVDRLARASGGSIERSWNANGLEVVLKVPATDIS